LYALIPLGVLALWRMVESVADTVHARRRTPLGEPRPGCGAAVRGVLGVCVLYAFVLSFAGLALSNWDSVEMGATLPRSWPVAFVPLFIVLIVAVIGTYFLKCLRLMVRRAGCCCVCVVGSCAACMAGGDLEEAMEEEGSVAPSDGDGGAAEGAASQDAETGATPDDASGGAREHTPASHSLLRDGTDADASRKKHKKKEKATSVADEGEHKPADDMHAAHKRKHKSRGKARKVASSSSSSSSSSNNNNTTTTANNSNKPDPNADVENSIEGVD
jgi:hypothetical protein